MVLFVRIGRISRQKTENEVQRRNTEYYNNNVFFWGLRLIDTSVSRVASRKSPVQIFFAKNFKVYCTGPHIANFQYKDFL